jgi:PKD repeat protein
LAMVFALHFNTAIAMPGDGHPSPNANFEMYNFCWGGITNFTNTSSNLQNEGYVWTIWQQGVSAPVYTSTNTNINFQFPVKTTYTVTLNVKNYVTATHFHQDEVLRVLTLDSFPVANFDFQICQSRFVNLSCCTNTSLWDFGDGSPTSTVTCPTHTYAASGSYTVTLITGNGIISDTISQVIIPSANILSGDFSITYDGDTVRFKTLVNLVTVDDSLRGNTWDWEWDLGDGSGVDSAGLGGGIVNHYYQRYENDSTYKVSLTVLDACFLATGEKNVLIKGTGRAITGTHVFPSPVVHGYLNIESSELSELKEIRIIDCLGKKLDDLVPSRSRYGYYIYINTIPSGVYIVQLVFGDRLENYKIIKE